MADFLIYKTISALRDGGSEGIQITCPTCESVVRQPWVNLQVENDLTLRELILRLKCRQCGTRPLMTSVELYCLPLPAASHQETVVKGIKETGLGLLVVPFGLAFVLLQWVFQFVLLPGMKAMEYYQAGKYFQGSLVLLWYWPIAVVLLTLLTH